MLTYAAGYEMMLSYIGGAQDPKNYSPPIAELSDEQVVVSIREEWKHSSGCSIRQHTSEYVSIRQHGLTYADVC